MIDVFEKSAREYDDWFDRNKIVYQSKLLAIKAFLPRGGNGLEIGVGTGRFAAPLRIEMGVEPARAMAEITGGYKSVRLMPKSFLLGRDYSILS